MAFTIRCLDLHFVWFDRQRVAAGFSQSQYGCQTPWSRAFCVRLQSSLSGHSHPVVILRCITGSRVAAETGCQPRRDHRLSNLNAGIRCGFHFDHLRPAGSHYDGGAAGCRLYYGRCRRPIRKSFQLQQRSPGNHTGSQMPGGRLL